MCRCEKKETSHTTIGSKSQLFIRFQVWLTRVGIWISFSSRLLFYVAYNYIIRKAPFKTRDRRRGKSSPLYRFLLLLLAASFSPPKRSPNTEMLSTEDISHLVIPLTFNSRLFLSAEETCMSLADAGPALTDEMRTRSRLNPKKRRRKKRIFQILLMNVLRNCQTVVR